MSLLNRPLLGIVAFFGIGSIIGSGFCFWVFTNNNNNPYISLDGITVDYSTAAVLGHFSNNLEEETFPTLLVFTEGNSPTEINDGIEFYKKVYNSELGTYSYERDDSIEVTFHRNNNFNNKDAEDVGLKFQLGVTINLKTTAPDNSNVPLLTDYLRIAQDLYVDGNFVNLTNEFTIVDNDFKHEKELVDLDGEVIDPNDSYSVYEYNLHLDDLFGYRSLDIKPDTLDKYKKLYQAFNKAQYVENGETKSYWQVEIIFTARYVENN